MSSNTYGPNGCSSGCGLLVIGIFAITVAFHLLTELGGFLGHVLMSYYPLFLGVAVLITVVVCYSHWAIAKEAQRAAEKVRMDAANKAEAAEMRALDRRQKIVQEAEMFEARLTKYLTEVLVIDSNIWMNASYDDFFQTLTHICHNRKIQLNLFGTQFDEISNIKRSTKFGDSRNKRARHAIDRIEKLQKLGLLTVESITINSNKGAYADALIVKLLTTSTRSGKHCTFISDDKELRIRVRQHLSNLAEAHWQIVEIEDILHSCSAYIESLRI